MQVFRFLKLENLPFECVNIQMLYIKITGNCPTRALNFFFVWRDAQTTMPSTYKASGGGHHELLEPIAVQQFARLPRR